MSRCEWAESFHKINEVKILDIPVRQYAKSKGITIKIEDLEFYLNKDLGDSMCSMIASGRIPCSYIRGNVHFANPKHFEQLVKICRGDYTCCPKELKAARRDIRDRMKKLAEIKNEEINEAALQFKKETKNEASKLKVRIFEHMKRSGVWPSRVT